MKKKKEIRVLLYVTYLTLDMDSGCFKKILLIITPINFKKKLIGINLENPGGRNSREKSIYNKSCPIINKSKYNIGKVKFLTT